MLDFQEFSEFFVKKRNTIDNTTFRLHYRVTFGVLVLMSALNTSHKFIGSPISCMTHAPDTSIVNNYCWIHGTFTSVVNSNKSSEDIYPGVKPRGTDKNGNEIYHAWYQWVHMVLFIQAVLCYVPHWIWESLEGGKMDMLLQNLDQETLEDPEDLKQKRLSIAHYFIRTKGTHRSYTYRFLFCEFLNLANVVGQMFIMNSFLGGQFSAYGRDVITMSEGDFESRIDPLNRVFPKMTKCDFHMYGPSGTIQNFDSLCLLPVNIINEKIYIFLWFWFVFVAVFTSIHLVLKTISLISGQFRLFSLSNVAKTITRDDLKGILKKCNYGDWFVLMQLGKFIQPVTYHHLLLDLRDRLDKKRAENLD